MMLIVILGLVFFAVFTLALAVASTVKREARPTLKIMDEEMPREQKKKKVSLLAALAFFNAPLCVGPIGERMSGACGRASAGVSGHRQGA